MEDWSEGPQRSHRDKKEIRQGLSWWFSGYDSMLPMQGAEVRSLVRELRSHMPQTKSLHATIKILNTAMKIKDLAYRNQDQAQPNK